MDNEITKLDKKFIRLEQIVIDGFARSLENDQTMLAKQEYTNGCIGDAQREITSIEKEEPTIQTIVTETYEGRRLIKETTYSEIPVKTESTDIDNLQAKIAKIDSAISQWNAKKKPLQDILDRYNALQPVVEVIEEPEIA